MAQVAGLPVEEVDALLNIESGLKGICGSNDMREVLQRAHDGDRHAVLAVKMYTYRIKKYIGAYAAILPSVDAVVFTAGIGEHSAEIRAYACESLENLGICLDKEKNMLQTRDAFAIQSHSSAVKIFVIPTNEELEMAKQTLHCLKCHGADDTSTPAESGW
jgi:acetate kinase